LLRTCADRRALVVVVDLREGEGWSILVDEVDGAPHCILGLAWKAHDERRVREDAVLLQTTNPVAVAVYIGELRHVLEDGLVARFDTEEDPHTARALHELECLVVGVGAAEERHPT